MFFILKYWILYNKMFKFLFSVCKILLLLSISLYFLKGLPHEMELAYDDMYGYNSSGNK